MAIAKVEDHGAMPTRVKKIEIKKRGCPCGRSHTCEVGSVIVGSRALLRLPEELSRLGVTRPFILSDVNTRAAAAEQVEKILSEAKIPYSGYCYPEHRLEPDERAVSAAEMSFERECDCVIAVGSGVIGDIAKLLAKSTATKYAIVATAPSMDGFASATSSMTVGGLKVSLASRAADLIIGDTDILKNAPRELLVSGLGDMLAKYISIAEWRISNLLTGEYYCEDIAELMRSSLAECVENAGGLLRREDKAVEAVFRGLVTAGMAMSYAGASRPASGVEHYFSHLWDMRGVEFGDATSTHGIQCAVGTLIAARLYEGLNLTRPDTKRAEEYVSSFDFSAWSGELRAFLGKGAEAMIALEEKERKYSLEKHRERIRLIEEKWDEMTTIVYKEIPSSAEIEKILDTIGCPKSPSELGIDEALLPMTLKATKDIRDKYILSRLLWDVGLLDEFAQRLR